MTEQQVQRKIKKHLEAKGCHVTKYNANAYGVAGHPDLFVSIPQYNWLPVAVFFEVKTDTGVLSKIQKLKIADLNKNGHLAVVVKSVEDVDMFFLLNNIKTPLER